MHVCVVHVGMYVVCVWVDVVYIITSDPHSPPPPPPTHSPYTPVGTRNLLKLHNIVILISTDQTGHSLDLGVVLIRFGLGRRGM